MFRSEELKMNKRLWRSAHNNATEANHETVVIRQGRALLRNKVMHQLLGERLATIKYWAFQQQIDHE